MIKRLNGYKLKSITHFDINLKFDYDHYDEIRLQLNHRFFTLRDKIVYIRWELATLNHSKLILHE